MGPHREIHLKSYTRVMVLLGLLHLVASVLFFLFPLEAFYLLNTLPTVLKLAEAVPVPSDRFLLSIACSGELMVGLLFLMSGIQPRLSNIPWVLILGKTANAAALGYLFFTEHKYFAYLALAIVDAVIVLLLLWKRTLLSATGSLKCDAIQSVTPAPEPKPLKAEPTPTLDPQIDPSEKGPGL